MTTRPDQEKHFIARNGGPKGLLSKTIHSNKEATQWQTKVFL